MNAMTYKGYAARVEFDADDEIFTGRIAGIRDVVGFHADTVADLKTAFHEAVDDYVETCRKAGKSPQKPYSGNLMLRVDPLVHSRVAIAAELSGKSLNEWGSEVLSKAAIHEARISSELARVARTSGKLAGIAASLEGESDEDLLAEFDELRRQLAESNARQEEPAARRPRAARVR